MEQALSLGQYLRRGRAPRVWGSNHQTAQASFGNAEEVLVNENLAPSSDHLAGQQFPGCEPSRHLIGLDSFPTTHFGRTSIFTLPAMHPGKSTVKEARIAPCEVSRKGAVRGTVVANGRDVLLSRMTESNSPSYTSQIVVSRVHLHICKPPCPNKVRNESVCWAAGHDRRRTKVPCVWLRQTHCMYVIMQYVGAETKCQPQPEAWVMRCIAVLDPPRYST